MLPTNRLSEKYKIVSTLLDHFYHFIQEGKAEHVFHMLSPNLQCLTVLDQHTAKYQNAFKFGRKLIWMNLFYLATSKDAQLEAIVMLCYLAESANSSWETQQFEDNKRYSAYKIQLVFIDQYWFINEINLYQEFWEKEFKEYVQSQCN